MFGRHAEIPRVSGHHGRSCERGCRIRAGRRKGRAVPEILTTDGVHLWASDDGSGPPVVLVAGYTAPAASWAFQVEALTRAGYRAIALDRRSHGRSEAPWYGQ